MAATPSVAPRRSAPAPPSAPEPPLAPARPAARLRRVAFVVGIVLGSRHEPSERRVAARFAAAWERGDYATMHSLLTAKARGEYPLRRFSRAYARAADTATLAEVRASRPRVRDGGRVDARRDASTTRIFGDDLGPSSRSPVAEDDDGTAGHRVAAGAGVPRPARRRAAGARDEDAAARGDPGARRHDRSPTARRALSDLGPLASEIAGRLGPAPPEREEELARRGVPEGTPVGPHRARAQRSTSGSRARPAAR